MDAPVLRLGDLIDDFCPRCRLPLNHAIASFMDGKVVKVVCQTCHSEHPFLHGENPAKKKPPKGSGTAFDQVLAKVTSGAAAAAEPSAKSKTKAADKGTEARYISRHHSSRSPRKKS
jgi:uncharacterized Zn finger protein (UPF0148 family)